MKNINKQQIINEIKNKLVKISNLIFKSQTPRLSPQTIEKEYPLPGIPRN